MRRNALLPGLILILAPLCSPALPFREGHTLFGDLKISQPPGVSDMPHSFNLELRTLAGIMVNRTVVPANSRYRFLSVANGEYELVIENGDAEAAKIHLLLQEEISTDIRKDIGMEWRPNLTAQAPGRKTQTAATELYVRKPEHEVKLGQALKAVAARQEYRIAIQLLHEITKADPNDFEVWTELGTIYFRQGKLTDAHNSYQQALRLRPSHPLTVLNLGKILLAQKKYEAAVETLLGFVELNPHSPQGQFYLGEAFLQTMKGSRAVIHFNEALRLDPIGMAEAHLRMAALYHAAGRKDRAAAEYERFLTRKPDYQDREKLLRYIKANKK